MTWPPLLGQSGFGVGDPTPGSADFSPVRGDLDDLTDRVDALERGYRAGEPIYFHADGTFTKDDYPGLRAVMVEVVGGGGGGGGAAVASSGEGAAGGGGGGGGYSRKFILVADLENDETVTVGDGGAQSGSGESNGGNGGSSSFGSHCSATGGSGGNGAAAHNFFTWDYEGGNGNGSGGDLNLHGSAGMRGIISASDIVQLGAGGGSPLSGMSTDWGNSLGRSDGPGGRGPGGGGGGGYSRNGQTSATGGIGAGGLVIVTPLF